MRAMMHQMRLPYVSLGALVACGAPARPSTRVDNQAPAGAPGEPSIRSVDWQNFTYDLGQEGKYTLTAGECQFTVDSHGNQHNESWQPADPNDDVEHGWFEVGGPVYGDVDGDGADEAVIMTYLNTGGYGQLSLVSVYAMRDGKPVVIGTIPGGDRGDGGIANVSIDHGRVLVDRFESVEGEGECCPSQLRHELWIWKGVAFVEDERARTTSPNNEGGD